MLGFQTRTSIADQVSSSLKDPSAWSDAEVIEPVSETFDSDSNNSTKDKPQNEPQNEPNSSEQGGQTAMLPKSDLPTLEECLYGPATRRSPYIPDDESEDGDEVDDGLNSRWSQNPDVRADYHDIDMEVLRKLCSQGSGIPEDEGPRGSEEGSSIFNDSDSNASRTRGTCHRGIAWRVLLEQLPVRDVHATWPKILPPQRKLYKELVEKYLENAVDPGKLLKGESHWEQSLRMKSDSSLRESSSKITDGGKDDGGNQKDATEDIHDYFPPNSKYRDLFQKSGITLNLGESAAAIGMNRLKIPKELCVEDEEESAASGNSNQSQKDDLFERFCKDAKLLSEIRKDVVRTNPHLRFYLETRDNLWIRRHAALERILFVWAKLNGNLYVQGMNEIVGTIYYVLAMDPTTSSGTSVGNHSEKQCSWADHAEADTYYLFNSLLNTMEVRDVFIADLDHDADIGLHARIKKIEMLLKEHDPEIFNHLKGSLGLDSSFYAIRWLTTLLSREFRLPDTIRLWDSMLASTHKENFLRYVCASMVMAIRDRLLRGDFGTCLKLLQNYPSGEIGMDELLESSRALWIYETQISLACQKGGVPLRQALKVITPPEGVIMAFGRPGGKRLGLREQFSDPVVGVIRNVASSTTAAANNNVGKLVGRAKQLWQWRSPAKKERKTLPERVESPVDATKDDEDDWDIIDSIIDGKTEFVTGSGFLSSISSNGDSIGSIPKPGESTDSSKFTTAPPPPAVTPQATPTSSPSRQLWNRSRPADVLNDDDGVVEDFSNNDGPLNQSSDHSNNAGFWNRMKRSY